MSMFNQVAHSSDARAYMVRQELALRNARAAFLLPTYDAALVGIGYRNGVAFAEYSYQGLVKIIRDSTHCNEVEAAQAIQKMLDDAKSTGGSPGVIQYIDLESTLHCPTPDRRYLAESLLEQYDRSMAPGL